MDGGSDPVPGVARSLAVHRAGIISNLRYYLSLDIPDEAVAPIAARVSIQFIAADISDPLVLDFRAGPGRLTGVSIDERPCRHNEVNGHIVIAPEHLRAGENTVDVEFFAGDAPLNRSSDLLYSLFVPARAHHCFPCFDQPDLKARFTLELTLPSGWDAVTNASEISRLEASNARALIRFAETLPISTYLFAFAAGRFQTELDVRDGRAFRMLHRETDPGLITRNRDAIFDLHAFALGWLEEYTGIPYPFGKFDFVLVPSFQFGGMEHPGAIFYNAASLLLEASVTEHQQLARAHLIAHETAHMWFGDLVTMPWFDDVWMKEVFANLMAARIVNPSFPQLHHDLRFLVSHYPAAYSVDRTAGTHPIRQELDNLDDAGSLYGPIIYQKAPIVLQQLEELIGAARLRDGLQVYLRTFSFASAAWLELLRILGERTDHDLESWSEFWIEDSGRPAVPVSRPDVTSHFRPGAGFLAAPTSRDRGDRADANWQDVASERRTFPYGAVILDIESRAFLIEHVEKLADPFARGAAWITLWEEMLDARVPPAAFVDAAARAISTEPVEQLVQLVTTYLCEGFWRFLPDDARLERAARVEATLRSRMVSDPVESNGGTLAAACLAAFRAVVSTSDGVRFLERLWRREEILPGRVLTEVDDIAISLDLAVRSVPSASAIFETQRQRITNPDRRARFEFVMAAAAADKAARDRFFISLFDPGNRRREPWVIEGLRLLHHPLRAPDSLMHLRPALDLLEEIQRTGDIFFPKQWMDAVLSGHNTRAAADIVRAFLAERHDYPLRLRRVILQSADNLFRATTTPRP